MHVAGLSIFAPREDGLAHVLTMCSGSSRPESIWHPDCDNVCPSGSGQYRADPCGWTMSNPIWTSTSAVGRSAPPAVGSSREPMGSAASSPDRSIFQSKPLWELYVVEGVDADTRGGVLFLKLHPTRSRTGNSAAC